MIIPDYIDYQIIDDQPIGVLELIPKKLTLSKAVKFLRKHYYVLTKSELFELILMLSIPFKMVDEKLIIKRTDFVEWFKVDDYPSLTTAQNRLLCYITNCMNK